MWATKLVSAASASGPLTADRADGAARHPEHGAVPWPARRAWSADQPQVTADPNRAEAGRRGEDRPRPSCQMEVNHDARSACGQT